MSLQVLQISGSSLLAVTPSANTDFVRRKGMETFTTHGIMMQNHVFGAELEDESIVLARIHDLPDTVHVLDMVIHVDSSERSTTCTRERATDPEDILDNTVAEREHSGLVPSRTGHALGEVMATVLADEDSFKLTCYGQIWFSPDHVCPYHRCSHDAAGTALECVLGTSDTDIIDVNVDVELATWTDPDPPPPAGGTGARPRRSAPRRLRTRTHVPCRSEPAGLRVTVTPRSSWPLWKSRGRPSRFQTSPTLRWKRTTPRESDHPTIDPSIPPVTVSTTQNCGAAAEVSEGPVASTKHNARVPSADNALGVNLWSGGSAGGVGVEEPRGSSSPRKVAALGVASQHGLRHIFFGVVKDPVVGQTGVNVSRNQIDDVDVPLFAVRVGAWPSEEMALDDQSVSLLYAHESMVHGVDDLSFICVLSGVDAALRVSYDTVETRTQVAATRGVHVQRAKGVDGKREEKGEFYKSEPCDPAGKEPKPTPVLPTAPYPLQTSHPACSAAWSPAQSPLSFGGRGMGGVRGTLVDYDLCTVVSSCTRARCKTRYRALCPACNPSNAPGTALNPRGATSGTGGSPPVVHQHGTPDAHRREVDSREGAVPDARRVVGLDEVGTGAKRPESLRDCAYALDGADKRREAGAERGGWYSDVGGGSGARRLAVRGSGWIGNGWLHRPWRLLPRDEDAVMDGVRLFRELASGYSAEWSASSHDQPQNVTYTRWPTLKFVAFALAATTVPPARVDETKCDAATELPADRVERGRLDLDDRVGIMGHRGRDVFEAELAPSATTRNSCNVVSDVVRKVWEKLGT
ncbi:uncharacterized protein BXZ73DRAFT_80449 [Epithele typhae]|uniref:uncharacterized protein n=1 Tax=Epithele typhae TaxID=378194 RepID=UPI002008263C|nr:uncharacterized protein BXZ73DRAFT_80449 [Epithele typhae]KAH9918911.1 hypothetical protein BXZ73DRAFT_80449 [Epithele typhae]